MPEPNRPPWRIADALSGFPIGDLIDTGVTVIIACESCRHEAAWSPGDLARRFDKAREATLNRIGPRLRCGKCRSEWVRLSRG
jgi:hypothetical protein